jgi:hypothetical protein
LTGNSWKVPNGDLPRRREKNFKKRHYEEEALPINRKSAIYRQHNNQASSFKLTGSISPAKAMSLAFGFRLLRNKKIN